MRPFTRLIHTKHAKVLDPDLGIALDDANQSAACLRCHAGPEQDYVRGVHHNTIASDGTAAISCQNCHGNLTAIGNKSRQGWLDEPLCQSCHTGTATANSGQLRYTNVFTVRGDLRAPVDLTYATQTNTTAAAAPLFRSAPGHGGLFCEACHGATHAEVASAQPNDNVQNQTLQGHPGTLMDCTPCHTTTPTNPWTGGPHGMHAVGQEWIPNHGAGANFFGQPWCAECHGSDLTGTVLSLMPTNRNLVAGLTLWRGFQLGCFACHESGFTPNNAAAVSNVTTNTTANRPVTIKLPGTDGDGDALSFRIVTQPTNGTAVVVGNLATYYPATNFIGTDAFTFSAWDGLIDSNLGTNTVSVASGACVLSATATAPTAALPAATVPFGASARLNQCVGPLTFDWDFGDGTPHSSAANACHTYAKVGDYSWKLTVTGSGLTQVVNGLITISLELGPPVALTLTQAGGVVTVSWLADRIGTSLEVNSDPTIPLGWQPVVDPAPPVLSGSTFIYQSPMTPDPQFFRVRRVP